MNAHEYLDAAWEYWGIDAGPDKPDVRKLSDEDLQEVQHFDAPHLPHKAHGEVLDELDRRKMVHKKLYREVAAGPPRKKRR